MVYPTQRSFISFVVSVSIWLMLPLHCLLHCAPQTHHTPHSTGYVCAMVAMPQIDTGVQRSNTQTFTAAVYELIRSAGTPLVFVTVTVLVTTAAALLTSSTKPAIPPPR